MGLREAADRRDPVRRLPFFGMPGAGLARRAADRGDDGDHGHALSLAGPFDDLFMEAKVQGNISVFL